MNKTYTVDKDVRNSFKRILKDISNSADLSWTEEATDDQIVFTLDDCSENVLELVDKFSKKLSTVNLTVRTKSKNYESIQKIVYSLDGKFSASSQKNYCMVSLSRCNYENFCKAVEKKDIKANISRSLF